MSNLKPKENDTTPPKTGTMEERFDNAFKLDNYGSSTAVQDLVKRFIHSETSLAVQEALRVQREQFKNRVNNVLAQKIEGVARIDGKLERAVLSCLSEEYSDEAVQSLPGKK